MKVSDILKAPEKKEERMRHSVSRCALTALFVTMLIGTAVSCSDEPPREEGVLRSIAATSRPAKTEYTVGAT
jgi:hypothetical protein